ncbi:efflux transporter outer membrane subunit [Rubrivivax albus]|uniref:Efflux transporter outer membrane subunit n=1 Tax=Rubrivivax albus TaxID=2499835 RepID=A0A3S2URI3_9BURK|nr:efflux transporter outer membrane subunit [Rubrivivax albus]
MASVLLTAVAGCASLQEPAPADLPTGTVPTAWQAPAPAGEPARVAATSPWQDFADPALAVLVAQALAQGTDVAAAQARLRQARAARDLSAAGLRPSVGGSASARSSWVEGARRSESWQAGMDASWEVDLWGGGQAGVRAAEATLQASALSLAQTRLVVAAEVAATLIDLRTAQARQAIAARNLASQQQTLQIVQWRAEAGLVTALDVAQARTAVDQTRAQLPALGASAQQALHALAVLTGQPPAALQATLGAPASPVVQPLAATTPALAVPAEVLRRRPDVQAAERQLAAAAARVDQADAARLPSLNLGGSIGLSALSLGALGPGAGVASLLASVNLPVLDFGRVQAQVRQQEAARDEAATAYRATVLGALQDVEDSLVALGATGAQLQAQQAAATSAREAATLADQRYRSGLVDFATVLQSQRTQLSAEDAVAATRGTLATAQVRLIKALGGGWSPDAPQDSEPLAAR